MIMSKLKETKRKAFNFLRSYYDVYNQLEKDSDKLSFLDAILNKQFLNEDPKDLEFLPKLCYEGQRHAIESSIKGWIKASKTSVTDTPRTDPPTDPPTPLGTDPLTHPKEEEEKEEEEEEVKEKEKEKPYRKFKHLSISNNEYVKLLITYSELQVNDTLDSIENYKKNTNYTSLYLTASKWLKKEYPLQTKSTTNKYSVEMLKRAKNLWEMDKIITKGFDKNDLHLIGY
jgi:hypothetical protein